MSFQAFSQPVAGQPDEIPAEQTPSGQAPAVPTESIAINREVGFALLDPEVRTALVRALNDNHMVHPRLEAVFVERYEIGARLNFIFENGVDTSSPARLSLELILGCTDAGTLERVGDMNITSTAEGGSIPDIAPGTPYFTVDAEVLSILLDPRFESAYQPVLHFWEESNLVIFDIKRVPYNEDPSLTQYQIDFIPQQTSIRNWVLRCYVVINHDHTIQNIIAAIHHLTGQEIEDPRPLLRVAEELLREVEGTPRPDVLRNVSELELASLSVEIARRYSDLMRRDPLTVEEDALREATRFFDWTDSEVLNDAMIRENNRRDLRHDFLNELRTETAAGYRMPRLSRLILRELLRIRAR